MYEQDKADLLKRYDALLQTTRELIAAVRVSAETRNYGSEVSRSRLTAACAKAEEAVPELREVKP